MGKISRHWTIFGFICLYFCFLGGEFMGKSTVPFTCNFRSLKISHFIINSFEFLGNGWVKVVVKSLGFINYCHCCPSPNYFNRNFISKSRTIPTPFSIQSFRIKLFKLGMANSWFSPNCDLFGDCYYGIFNHCQPSPYFVLPF